MYDNRYHDLGHVSCLGYNSAKDVLFSGRVIDDVPRIQIYNKFLTACTEGAILAPSDGNCITIELDNALLESRTSFDCTTGDCYNVIYGYCTTLSESDNAVLLYKILLGTGTTDLSGETDGYGTYTSASDGEYNGTCQILNSWTLPAVDRQPQLIRWHKGGLLMMTSNHDTIIHKYKFVDDEFTEIEQAYINDLDASGAVIDMEAEGVIFTSDNTYITLWEDSTPYMRLISIDY